MKIHEALKNLSEKRLDLMKENFSQALTQKAVEKLHEKKQEVAAKIMDIK